MKFINKKISFGVYMASIFIISSIIYSISYNIAMNKFNSIVSYINEKQKMYSKLGELDYCIRQEYIGKFEEEDILDGICKGYTSGLKNKNCKYFTQKEYEIYNKKEEKKFFSYDLINNNILYINIKSFEENTSDLFINNLKIFMDKNINKLIIDIRDNNSSNLENITKILDYLLPKDNIINIIDKKNNKKIVFNSNSEGLNAQIIILTNAETAGVSEVFASALKDAEKAKILGTATKGQASKEKILKFSDNSVLIFSEAYYTTKSENILFGKGLIPNIEIDLEKEKYELLLKSELSYENDDQIQKAENILKSE